MPWLRCEKGKRSNCCDENVFLFFALFLLIQFRVSKVPANVCRMRFSNSFQYSIAFVLAMHLLQHDNEFVLSVGDEKQKLFSGRTEETKLLLRIALQIRRFMIDAFFASAHYHPIAEHTAHTESKLKSLLLLVFTTQNCVPHSHSTINGINNRMTKTIRFVEWTDRVRRQKTFRQLREMFVYFSCLIHQMTVQQQRWRFMVKHIECGPCAVASNWTKTTAQLPMF